MGLFDSLFGQRTKTIKPPAASPQEQRSIDLSLLLEELGIGQLGYNVVQKPGGGIELVQRELTPEEEQGAQFEKDLFGRERRALLEDISPETRELVGKEFEGARTRGEEDIRRFATELAGQRGLRVSDTPIGGEALRAQERLTSGLRSAEATALLSLADKQRLFGQALREFRENLKQQAFLNRSSIAGGTRNLGLELGNLRANLFRTVEEPSRLSQFSSGLQDIGDIVSSVGGIAKGAAGLFSGGVF